MAEFIYLCLFLLTVAWIWYLVATAPPEIRTQAEILRAYLANEEPRIKYPEAGETWHFEAENPFSESYDVKIIEIRGKYVQYAYSNLQTGSMPTASFIGLYTFKEDKNAG